MLVGVAQDDSVGRPWAYLFPYVTESTPACETILPEEDLGADWPAIAPRNW